MPRPDSEYHPQPVDTSQVKLPAELEDLLETLAENTHEVWAAQRMAQGWTFGATRDDAAKKHPGLVPYHELPELEKDYDRKTAGEALRLVIKSGYRIVRE